MFDESNVVGLDVYLAKKNIDEFQVIVDDCREEFRQCFLYLF